MAFNVISPDGLPIAPETYPTRAAAEKAAREFVKRFERQGYCASVEGRIPLELLPTFMEIVEEDAADMAGLGRLDPAMLDQFTGTEGYHRFSPIFRNVVLTDGAKYVADNGGEGGAYWLMDAIASQIPRAAKKHPMCRKMQFWELKVKPDKSAVLTAVPDSGMKPCVTQRIPYTDFDLPSIKLYVQPQGMSSGTVWVIFLPSEY